MPSEKSTVKGVCGKPVEAVVWKQGHGFKCSRRYNNRYWKPDKADYLEDGIGVTPGMTDLEAEVRDFCRGCSKGGK